jgi:hypothetical protein
MGFLDDSDSEFDMDDSCMNDMSISLSFHANGTYHGRRSCNNNNNNSNNNNSSNGDKKAFKFSWDDSGSSVCTADLDESEASSFGGFLSSGRHERSKNPSVLGKLLEKVDGVGYNQNNNNGKKPSCSLGGRIDSDSEEEEVDLLTALPVQKETKKVEPEPEPEPEPKPEPERETTIKFVDPIVTDMLEFNQYEDAPLSVWDEDHVAENHSQVPWDEEDYEELPWHMVPDLDEDDPLTKRCKEVVPNPNQKKKEDDDASDDTGDNDDDDDDGEEEEEDSEYRRRIDRLEARVIEFVLLLKYKRLKRKEQSLLEKDITREVQVCKETGKKTSDLSCADTVDTTSMDSFSSSDEARTFE